jgi:hypothetical protein
MSNPIVQTIYDVVHTGAENIGKRFNMPVAWISLFADNEDMRDHQDIKIVVTPLDQTLRYGALSRIPLGNTKAYFDTQKNDSDLPQSGFINRSYTDTSQFQWSLTEGLQVSSTQSITVKSKPWKIFEEISGSLSFTEQISFSATQQVTESSAETYTVQQNITVPARARLETNWIIERVQENVDWFMDIQISGAVAVWFKHKIEVYPGKGEHWLWFFPVAKIFQEAKNGAFRLAGDKVIFTAKGTVQADGVDKSYLDIKQYPLESPVAEAAVKTYRIDVGNSLQKLFADSSVHAS